MPEDESARLHALRRYAILDTPPEGAFDQITALAADLFRVPIAIVSLVDHDRIWFKSRHGLDAEQTGRDPGLCASAILSNDVYHICDAAHDVRSLTNPLVAGAFGLRFYAAAPLRTHDGFNLGTLCVIDREPRELTEVEKTTLVKLASVVMDQMELRLAARRVAELEQAQRRTNQDLEQRVRERTKEQDVLLEVNRAISRRLERDELFGALAACLRDLFETDRFGIELPIEGDRLQGHLLTPGSETPQPTRVKLLPAQGTACAWVLQNRQWLVASTREELRERFPLTFQVMGNEGMESLCAMPLVSGGRARGVLFFMAARTAAYRHLPRALLEQVTSAIAVALDDCLAHEEVRRLRDRLAAENVYLQEEIRQQHNFVEILGNSAPLLEVLRATDLVAPTDSTVLILGETGTGKELIARAIHDRSPRHGRPLVKVNCGAISPGLVDSELFGHVKGAFTGALTNHDGRFKLADGGTIFLDEVGELPLDAQVKLLRVLQEQEFEPVGSTKTETVNVRVIAASNRDLSAAVREGTFRADLMYRLSVFPLTVPPLRERTEDIPLLVLFFVQKFVKKLGRTVTQVADETMRRLCAYPWPGNVRELQNIIERAVVLANGPVLQVEEAVLPMAAACRSGSVAPYANPGLPGPTGLTSSAATNERPSVVAPAPPRGNGGTSLEEVERQHILTVLTQADWKIEGGRGAAKVLNLRPSTLRSRMQKLGIARPRA